MAPHLNPRKTIILSTWGLMAIIGTLGQTHAQEVTNYKLSTGLYNFSNTGNSKHQAADINLRMSSDEIGHAWIAWYRSPWENTSQERVGWDKTFSLSDWRISPSLQAASGGFIGGSLNIETGKDFFIGTGFGRTNLKNYYNLNVDPNDSWSLSGGYRWSENHYLALQIIRDNRVNPDQQNTHLIYKHVVQEKNMLTYDLLYKQGTVESHYIREYGLSIAYDWDTYQVKCAYDPKTNFTPQNLVRLTFAKHF